MMPTRLSAGRLRSAYAFTKAHRNRTPLMRYHRSIAASRLSREVCAGNGVRVGAPTKFLPAIGLLVSVDHSPTTYLTATG